MRSLLLALAFATPALAAEPVCGTSPDRVSEARQLARFVNARAESRAFAARPVRPSNGFLVVPADDQTAPFDDPADLEGMSFLFTPAENGAFDIQRGPLQYDEDAGALFAPFERGETTKPIAFPFAFPFGAKTYSEAVLSVARGIHFTDRPALRTRNFAAFEMLTTDQPTIAPLLDHLGSPSPRPDIYVKQTGDAITITWRSQPGGVVSYDMQAVLFRNGNIRFAYKDLHFMAWGGVVLTTGEPRQSQKTILGAVGDPTGDVEPIFGASRDMLDVKRVEIARLDGTSMLEVQIEVAAPIDRNVLNPDAHYSLTLEDSINRLDVFVRPNGIIYSVPNVGDIFDRAVVIDGSTIAFFIDEELLALPSRAVRAWIHTNARNPADVVETTIDLGASPRSAEIDLSATATEKRGAIVETYSVPTVNVTRVWERLQQERGYRNDEIDAVFVYTTFLSDLIYKTYGAFALYANPGADGVSAHSSKSQPRTPTLVNMNRLGAFGNYDTDVLLHELGHRWLYYFDIIENGQRRRSVNPLGNHPAGFVHMPAAFSVNAGGESSVMGGATFQDLQNGSFRSPATVQWSSFAWHELYLMGLARTHEVLPWWYIRDSDPSLPLEYYPPGGVTVRGTRVDVTVQQIIAAMGERDPSFNASQKEFRALFVMLERDAQPVSPEVLETEYRTRLEEAFFRATGGRARLRSSATEPPRRRAVGRGETPRP